MTTIPTHLDQRSRPHTEKEQRIDDVVVDDDDDDSVDDDGVDE